MARLRGKFCIITGGASGLGYAAAAAFVHEGAEVLLTDINETAGAAAAQALRCEFRRLDVSDEAEWERLQEAFPRIDVLLNNAGVITPPHAAGRQDPEHVSLDDWRAVHRINLDGTFLGCRYAIRAMKAQQSGSIINMSSRAAFVGVTGASAYASSKAAIRNHTKSVALYCAEQGWQIRCNSVHPGSVLTPIWEPLLADAADRAQRIEALAWDTPLKRFGDPDEVAAVCVLLASDEARFITGSEFTIDGGVQAGAAKRRN